MWASPSEHWPRGPWELFASFLRMRPPERDAPATLIVCADHDPTAMVLLIVSHFYPVLRRHCIVGISEISCQASHSRKRKGSSDQVSQLNGCDEVSDEYWYGARASRVVRVVLVSGIGAQASESLKGTISQPFLDWLEGLFHGLSGS